MVAWIAANWQAVTGFVVATVVQAYLFLNRINKLEHRIEVLEKEQDEIKELLKEIREDIKSLMRASGR